MTVSRRIRIPPWYGQEWRDYAVGGDKFWRRRVLERLWAFAFGAPFSRVLRPPFGPALSTGGWSGTGSWWLAGGITAANCLAAYEAKNAPSLVLSYTNLANPGTYTITLGTAPAWASATGWTFTAASSQYLKTGLIPLINQTYSIIIRMDLSAASNNCPAFCRGGTNKDFGFYLGSTTQCYHYNGGVAVTSGLSDLRNDTILAVSANRFYQNTTLSAQVIGAGTPPTTKDLYIGAGNDNGTPNYYSSGNIYALAIYDISIASYIAALNTAIAAL